MLARFVVILFVAISAAKERDVVSMCVKSGLANRLRAFISYLNLARRTDRSMRLYWYPEDQCPGLFTDVFSDLPADIVVDATPPSRVPRVRCTNAAYRRASISDMGKSALSVLHPAAAVQTRIDELLVLLRGTALTIATSSPIPSTLSNTTNTSNATHKASVTADRPFVAVHIRRTDNNENYHNDARFVEWIGRVSPGSDPVFVAADNAMSLRTLRVRVPAAWAAFPRSLPFHSRNRSRGLAGCIPRSHCLIRRVSFVEAQTAHVTGDVRTHTPHCACSASHALRPRPRSAVVDMWVASHATHFKGTYASTFSQVRDHDQVHTHTRSPVYSPFWLPCVLAPVY